MAHKKRFSDGCVGEEPHPLPPASKEVLSCADSDGIITWVKPVGEPHANAFWRKYASLRKFALPFLRWAPSSEPARIWSEGK